MAVAIPASVGPLPMQQPFSERVRTLVGDAESEQRVQRVALLRRAAAIPAAHERDALTAVRLGFGPCGELVEIARTKPELEDALTKGMKAFIALGISEIGEAREDPVKPLPLVVDLPPRAGASELVAPREERAHCQGASDFLAEQPHGMPMGVP